ncbi:unnamed protein product, partial [Discosporangium mesarthrocarpum]
MRTPRQVADGIGRGGVRCRPVDMDPPDLQSRGVFSFADLGGYSGSSGADAAVFASLSKRSTNEHVNDENAVPHSNMGAAKARHVFGSKSNGIVAASTPRKSPKSGGGTAEHHLSTEETRLMLRKNQHLSIRNQQLEEIAAREATRADSLARDKVSLERALASARRETDKRISEVRAAVERETAVRAAAESRAQQAQKATDLAVSMALAKAQAEATQKVSAAECAVEEETVARRAAEMRGADAELRVERAQVQAAEARAAAETLSSGLRALVAEVTGEASEASTMPAPVAGARGSTSEKGRRGGAGAVREESQSPITVREDRLATFLAGFCKLYHTAVGGHLRPAELRYWLLEHVDNSTAAFVAAARAFTPDATPTAPDPSPISLVAEVQPQAALDDGEVAGSALNEAVGKLCALVRNGQSGRTSALLPDVAPDIGGGASLLTARSTGVRRSPLRGAVWAVSKTTCGASASADPDPIPGAPLETVAKVAAGGTGEGGVSLSSHGTVKTRRSRKHPQPSDAFTPKKPVNDGTNSPLTCLDRAPPPGASVLRGSGCGESVASGAGSVVVAATVQRQGGERVHSGQGGCVGSNLPSGQEKGAMSEATGIRRSGRRRRTLHKWGHEDMGVSCAAGTASGESSGVGAASAAGVEAASALDRAPGKNPADKEDCPAAVPSENDSRGVREACGGHTKGGAGVKVEPPLTVGERKAAGK